jgi:hypothetical protein
VTFKHYIDNNQETKEVKRRVATGLDGEDPTPRSL